MTKKKTPPAPWLYWARDIRWEPYFSCTQPYEAWKQTLKAADERAFLMEAAPQFSAWLSGRAFRLAHGPKPNVYEWNQGAPRASALGLYSEVTASVVLRIVEELFGGEQARRVREEVKRRAGKEIDNAVLQTEWEVGWEQEHDRFKR